MKFELEKLLGKARSLEEIEEEHRRLQMEAQKKWEETYVSPGSIYPISIPYITTGTVCSTITANPFIYTANGTFVAPTKA